MFSVCRRSALQIAQRASIQIPLAGQRRFISFDTSLVLAALSGACGGAFPAAVNYAFSRRAEDTSRVSKELAIVFFYSNAYQSRLYNILSGAGIANFVKGTLEEKREFVLYTSFVMARFVTLIELMELGINDIRFFQSSSTAKLTERLQRVKRHMADNSYGSPLVLFRSHQLGIAAEMESPRTDFVAFTKKSSDASSHLLRLNEKVRAFLEGVSSEQHTALWLEQLLAVQHELIEIMRIIDPSYRIIALERRLNFPPQS